MLARNRHAKSVWRKKRSQYSTSALLSDDPSFLQLKTVSKRLAIISRLQKKQKIKTIEGLKINKTHQKLDLDDQPQPPLKATSSQKRPATTTEKRKISNFRSVKQAYKEQKKINQYVIAQKYNATTKTAMSTGSTSVKEGLLGEYDRYNEMSKQELIEKLISLEYLANNIFRKNKVLEDRIRNLDPNYQAN